MDSVNKIVQKLSTEIADPVIILIFTAGFFLFLWGGVRFMHALPTSKGMSREEGKGHLLWGILGLVIMVSAMGIIRIIMDTMGINLNSGPATYGRQGGGIDQSYPFR
jgi:Type IV secretion system pilin